MLWPFFYNKNGVFHYIQNPEDAVTKPTEYWNCETKTFEICHKSQNYDRTSVPWVCFCKPEEIEEVIAQHLPNLKETVQNTFYGDELDQYNIFIVHTNLNINPVYLGFAGMKGIGETLWEINGAIKKRHK